MGAAADQSPEYWERIHREHGREDRSWYEPSPAVSLALIDESGLPAGAGIVDVGGGASELAGQLLHRGYTDVTVADISAKALEEGRQGLGEAAGAITWVEADVRSHDFGRRFDLWHDRALFHFMIEAADRDAYLATVRRSIAPGGHVILATFGPEGPTECSGLPVRRYSPDSLQDALGAELQMRSFRLVEHLTPAGKVQQFLYAHLRQGGPMEPGGPVAQG